MAFEVGVVSRFTARHHLVGDFGPASEPHEHDYRVEVSVAGGGLRADGTLLDITLVQAALDGAIADVDGRDLNAVRDLATPNPTVEVVARYFVTRISTALPRGGWHALTARVWESPTVWASYTMDVHP